MKEEEKDKRTGKSLHTLLRDFCPLKWPAERRKEERRRRRKKPPRKVRPEVRLSASEALNHPWFDY